MMDSLRSATQNTMFEQWLDATITMKPALEPKQDRLHQQQVLHLLRHMHVLQTLLLLLLWLLLLLLLLLLCNLMPLHTHVLKLHCDIVFNSADVVGLAEQSNQA